MEIPNLDQVRYVRDLATQITAKEEELNQLLQRWYLLFPNASIDNATDKTLPEPQSIGSLDEKILLYLEKHAKREFNVITLIQELQLSSVSIGTVLSRLTRDGKIIRTGRGLYRAKGIAISDETSFSLKGEEPTEVGS